MASIFSRYSQGENRITSSILAVLRLLSLPAFEFLLLGITNREIGLHNISDQPSQGGEGIPDGEISANYKILIETKMPGAKVDAEQLERHLKRFSGNMGLEALVYLSADEESPEELNGLDERVLWKSFADIRELFSDLVSHPDITLSSIEKFMIEQLVTMIDNEGLLPSNDKVVVVAAKLAWPVYNEHGIYICQPNRSFRNVTHMGFYADGEVKPLVAHIIQRHPALHIDLLPEHLSGRVKAIANNAANDAFFEGEIQIFELTNSDHESTVKLSKAIPNDCTAKHSNRKVAFTQSQTYTSFEKLSIEGVTTSRLRD